MQAINDSLITERQCSNCNTTVTPLWRKFGPVKFLCNACGLYYKVNGDHRPYFMSKNKLSSLSKKSLLSCANCGTNKTTMWRKNGDLHVCNACGLYFRINGHNRPVAMRKDVIRTRRRRDTSSFDMIGQIDTSADSTSDCLMLNESTKQERETSCSKVFNVINITSTSEHSVGSAGDTDYPHHHYHHHHHVPSDHSPQHHSHHHHHHHHLHHSPAHMCGVAHQSDPVTVTGHSAAHPVMSTGSTGQLDSAYYGSYGF